MAEYRATTVPRPAEHGAPLEFPGCRPVHISRAGIVDFERRIEYWDAATETAMVCEPVSTYHEHPGQRLRELLTLIAQMRGSPIATFGAADLLLPDVVLEVDNTTDVRRGKLSLYESWGFPEVWVEVPEQFSPSRPAGLRPGLTIHLLEGGRFRTASSSRAFPGWTAQEIHHALNEPELWNDTPARLRRVARTLGAADGSGPDDDPLLRAERLESRAEGQAEARVDAVLQILESRGLPVSAAFPRRLAELRAVSTAALVQAALECRDEADFLRSIGA